MHFPALLLSLTSLAAGQLISINPALIGGGGVRPVPIGIPPSAAYLVPGAGPSGLGRVAGIPVVPAPIGAILPGRPAANVLLTPGDVRKLERETEREQRRLQQALLRNTPGVIRI